MALNLSLNKEATSAAFVAMSFLRSFPNTNFPLSNFFPKLICSYMFLFLIQEARILFLILCSFFLQKDSALMKAFLVHFIVSNKFPCLILPFGTHSKNACLAHSYFSFQKEFQPAIGVNFLFVKSEFFSTILKTLIKIFISSV